MKTDRVARTVLLVVGLVAAAVAVARTAATEGPEEVTIQELSRWFGPVTFSHGAHASLAGDCVSCHHHSDGEAAPCSTCHPVLFDPAQPTVPTVSVAFHQRCVGCHRTAGSGPMGCEACHKRKSLPPGPPLVPAK